MAGATCRSMEILGHEDACENERARENAENSHAPDIRRNVQLGVTNELVQAEMDPNLWGNLEKDVLEMIIRRLPPKNIVQSQVLSRPWRSRFLSRDFQKEVSRLSSSWGPSISYHPLCLSKKGLFGYDWSSLRWKYLCSLPDFPSDSIDELEELGACPEKGRLLIPQNSSWRLRASNCHLSGSLIFSMFATRISVFDTIVQSITSYFNTMVHIMVTNAITKTVRRLPSLRVKTEFDRQLRPDCYVLVNDDVYEIVMFDQIKEAGILYATVYHSSLNSWTENKSAREMIIGVCLRPQEPGVILRGVIYLYLSAYTPEGEDVFVTYDVRKRIFEKTVLSAPIRGGRLVVWRDHLMVVVVDIIYPDDDQIVRYDPMHVSIFEVNLDTLQPTLVSATLVSSGRPEDISDWDFSWEIERGFPISGLGADTECIYMNVDCFFRHEETHIVCRDMLFIPAICDWKILPCRSEEEEVHSIVSNIHPVTPEMTRTERRNYGPGRGRWLVFNVNHNRWNCFTVSACRSEHPQSECISIRNSDSSGQVFQPGLNSFVPP